MRFEKKEDANSIFANQLDKYQAIEKAFEYEQKGENVSTQQFIDYAEAGSTRSVLVKRLQDIKVKLANIAK